MLLIARVLHVVLGIFWVGAVLFNTFFLMPAMREAGPDGAKVGAALMRKGFATIMPVAAVLTILSGLWLYWRMVGFSGAAMESGRGMTFGLGGLSAILAFAIGMASARPAMIRAMTLAQTAANAPEAERPALMALATKLRVRSMRANLLVAILLVFTAITMSIGRYM